MIARFLAHGHGSAAIIIHHVGGWGGGRGEKRQAVVPVQVECLSSKATGVNDLQRARV